MSNMTSSRPYLIRATYEWIMDNTFTPYMMVDSNSDDVLVPRAFIENGRIILNISPDATHSLVLGNDSITFNARFSGTAMDVIVPVESVLAIYAHENGRGMIFDDQDDPPHDSSPRGGNDGSTRNGKDSGGASAPTQAKRPNLKIVK